MAVKPVFQTIFGLCKFGGSVSEKAESFESNCDP